MLFNRATAGRNKVTGLFLALGPLGFFLGFLCSLALSVAFWKWLQTGKTNQRFNTVHQFSAVVHPIVNAVKLDCEVVVCFEGIVVAEYLVGTAFTMISAVNSHHTIVRSVTAAKTSQTNTNCHKTTLREIVNPQHHICGAGRI
jgi:hypothetical protein